MQFYNRALGFAKEAIAGPLQRRQESMSIPIELPLLPAGDLSNVPAIG